MDSFFYKPNKEGVVYIFKKFSYIALERVGIAAMIAAYYPQIACKLPNPAMRPLPQPT